MRRPTTGFHTRPIAHALSERLLCLVRSHAKLVATREHGNDPSAGSPTETLLRLLLPLDDQV
jgi:hypothetical protein